MRAALRLAVAVVLLTARAAAAKFECPGTYTDALLTSYRVTHEAGGSEARVCFNVTARAECGQNGEASTTCCLASSTPRPKFTGLVITDTGGLFCLCGQPAVPAPPVPAVPSSLSIPSCLRLLGPTTDRALQLTPCNPNNASLSSARPGVRCKEAGQAESEMVHQRRPRPQGARRRRVERRHQPVKAANRRGHGLRRLFGWAGGGDRSTAGRVDRVDPQRLDAGSLRGMASSQQLARHSPASAYN